MIGLDLAQHTQPVAMTNLMLGTGFASRQTV